MVSNLNYIKQLCMTHKLTLTDDRVSNEMLWAWQTNLFDGQNAQNVPDASMMAKNAV